MTTKAELADDLLDEQRALDAVVAGLTDEQWHLATPSPGWDVADQIGHLTYFDGTAALAMTDPEGFRASARELAASRAADGASIADAVLGRGRTPTEHLAAWRENRRRLADAVPGLAEDARVPWYGPSMGAKSFLTARLMETWAHGQDVVDAVHAERPATDRLRHIAQLGVITRGWTYANRGLEVPAGDVRVVLDAPSGDRWTWGPEGAGATVEGPAEDFCLVVTQRRHVDDTALLVSGELARDWLVKAQAFAGGPTDGPARRSSAR